MIREPLWFVFFLLALAAGGGGGGVTGYACGEVRGRAVLREQEGALGGPCSPEGACRGRLRCIQHYESAHGHWCSIP